MRRFFACAHSAVVDGDKGMETESVCHNCGDGRASAAARKERKIIHNKACADSVSCRIDLGYYLLCGLALGVYSDLEEIKRNNKISETISPKKDDIWRDESIRKWRKAVSKALRWAED